MTTKQIEKLVNKKVDNVELIRSKDGINLYRVFCDKKSYIVKFFEKKQYSREIGFYKLFQEEGVPTIKVVSYAKNSLILQDLDNNKFNRLANEKDLENEEIIKSLAKWYKILHKKGKNVDKSKYYCEYNLITSKNLKMLQNILSEQCYNLLQKSMLNLNKLKCSLNYTITYNDFALENMAICNKRAIMFDYNLAGKGTEYADVQNVCAMLSKEMQDVFISAYYGKNPIPTKEIEAHYILGTLSSLILACYKTIFPKWANVLVNKVNSAEFMEKLAKL